MIVTLEHSSNVHQSPLHILSNDVQQSYNCVILDSFDVSQSVAVVFGVAEMFEDELRGVENQNHMIHPQTMMNGDDGVLERVYLPYY